MICMTRLFLLNLFTLWDMYATYDSCTTYHDEKYGTYIDDVDRNLARDPSDRWECCRSSRPTVCPSRLEVCCALLLYAVCRKGGKL